MSFVILRASRRMGFKQLLHDSKREALISRATKDAHKLCDIWLDAFNRRRTQDPSCWRVIEENYDGKKIASMSLCLGSRMCEKHGTQDRSDFVILAARVIKRLVGEEYVEPYLREASTYHLDLEKSIAHRGSRLLKPGQDIWEQRDHFPYLEWVCVATWVATNHFMNRQLSVFDEQLMLHVALNERY